MDAALSHAGLSHAGREVRRFDRDRFATALFAPPDLREQLLSLYAFNVEVARIREAVREPMAGMIRLQWWREALAGVRPDEIANHPVAAPLLEACRLHKVSGEAFERLLDAREADFDAQPPRDLAELEAYAEATSASLTQLALEILGVRDEESHQAGRAVGTAYALVGLLRSVPYQSAMGRLMVPLDLLAGAEKPSNEAISAAARVIAARADALLAEARRHPVDRRAIPALLPATLASGHLRLLERIGFDLFDARLALPRTMPVRLMWNVMRGKF